MKAKLEANVYLSSWSACCLFILQQYNYVLLRVCTDGRTGDYWKAELGAEVSVTGVAFAILVALMVCQSVVRIS